jgi:hypothetical protein
MLHIVRKFARSQFLRKMNTKIPNDPLKGDLNNDPLSSSTKSSENPRYVEEIRSQIVEQFSYLNSFQVRGYSFLKLSLATLAVIGAVLYIFGDDIKVLTARQGADMASIALGGEEIKTKAHEISKNVLVQILTDPKTQLEITGFFERSSADTKLQESISSLLTQLMENEETREVASQFLKASLTQLYKDPTVQAQSTEYVKWILRKEVTKKATSDLLSWSLDQKAVQDSTGRILVGLCKEDWVKDHITDLLKYSSMEVLKDEVVRDQAKDFVQTVLKDKNVHADAGNALWATVRNSLTPSYFK